MEILNRISRMASVCTKHLSGNVKLGFVHTMGGIHPGHVGLIHAARQMADLVVVSIFVNRLQFADEGEYRRYPRDLMKDVDLLNQEKVDYVFAPQEEEFFPAGFGTYVRMEESAYKVSAARQWSLLEGTATVMLKMMHIIRPPFLFLGQKDAIHGMILRKMVRDLSLATEVVTIPVVREPSGLAYGVRNLFLDETQRSAAGVIFRCLQEAGKAVAAGELQAKKICQEVSRTFQGEPLAEQEYAIILDPETLEPIAKIADRALIAVGARIGGAFLSDALIAEKPTKS